VSSQFDSLIKNYNVSKKSADIKKNIYSTSKNYGESIFKNNNNNNNNNFKKKNILNVNENTTKKLNFVNYKNKSNSATSRISPLDKKVKLTNSKQLNSDTKPSNKNSKTSSTVNLLNNLKINKDATLSKVPTKSNLTDNSYNNSQLLVSMNNKQVNNSINKLSKDQRDSKSNSIIIENIELQKRKNIPGFSKPITSNNNLIKSNINSNIQNVINGFKKHISSNNSPKNRPENKEYMIKQEKFSRE